LPMCMGITSNYANLKQPNNSKQIRQQLVVSIFGWCMMLWQTGVRSVKMLSAWDEPSMCKICMKLGVQLFRASDLCCEISVN
jgi:hypothetical protein